MKKTTTLLILLFLIVQNSHSYCYYFSGRAYPENLSGYAQRNYTETAIGLNLYCNLSCFMPGSLKCVCPKSSVFSHLDYAGGQLFTTCVTLNRTIDLTLSLPSIDEIPDDAGGYIHIDFMQYLNELNHQIADLGLASGKVKLNNNLG